MDLIALVSGGKDSIYNILECVRLGHRVVCIANLYPSHAAAAPSSSSAPDDVDSFMFQTVGSEAIIAVAECMGLPLVRRETQGKARDTSLLYDQDVNTPHAQGHAAGADTNVQIDEVEDLYELLKVCKANHPSADGLAVGAILSNYQRSRVETVCARADVALVPVAMLWQRSQARLLGDMCKSGLDAVLVKTAAYGLTRAHIGKPLCTLLPSLLHAARTYGLNPAGEGGEYESLALDCPQLYKEGRVVVKDAAVLGPGKGGMVWHYHVRSATVEGKSEQEKREGVSALAREQEEARAEGWGGVKPTLPAPFAGAGSCMGPVTLSTLPRPVAPYDHGLPGTAVRAGTGTAAGPAAVRHTGDGGQQVDVHTAHGTYTVRYNVATFMGQIHVGGLHAITSPPLPPDLPIDSPEVAARQVTACLHALDGCLKAQGSHLADACFVHLYLANMGHFHSVNTSYCAWFGAHPPARSAVAMDTRRLVPQEQGQGEGMGQHRPLVLLDVVAQTGSGWAVRAGRKDSRASLHIASLSKWAPLCIGPYCQANTLGDCLLWPAGQIGMRPETVALVQGGPHTQLLQALTNLSRVLANDTLSSSLPLSLSFVLYLSHETVMGQGAGQGKEVAQEVIHRAYAWLVGMFGKGIHPACLASSVEGTSGESGRVRLADVEDFGGPGSSGDDDDGDEEEGEGEGGERQSDKQGKEDACLTLCGLDNAEEDVFDLHSSAHTPPAYIVQAGHGPEVLGCQARHVAAATAPSTVQLPLHAPRLAAPITSLLPLLPIVVPALPRGAAVEVEAWGVTHEGEALLGGMQARYAELQEDGLAVRAHWLPNIAASVVVSCSGPAWYEHLPSCLQVCARSLLPAALPAQANMHMRVYVAAQGSLQEWEARVREQWASTCPSIPCPALTIIPVPLLICMGRQQPSTSTSGASSTEPACISLAMEGAVLHVTAWDAGRAGSDMWLRRHYKE